MAIKFQTKEFTIRDIFRNEYHCSELNGKEIVSLEFVESYGEECTYKVKLECGTILLAFSDEIKGA